MKQLFLIGILIVTIGVAACDNTSDKPTNDTQDLNTESGTETPFETVSETGWDPDNFITVIDVGPGHDYQTPAGVPWAELTASTLVRIHYRQEPYRSKWVITTIATRDNPLVVAGVASDGKLPVITGDDAVTPTGLYYLNETRSVIKVGNYLGEDDLNSPSYVYIENLDIRSGRPGYFYTDNDGNKGEYSRNAAAVHIETGKHITVKGCRLHDCGNGLFVSHLSNTLLISSNHIYDNGIEGRVYEHNTYTESQGITYEYNHFGPLREGCLGNNLKDRSAGTIIRFNLIEGGNRQLDLVDTDSESLFNDPSYDQTFVYGNILIERDGDGNSQIIHYGGDSGDTSMYRRGTLYFYHNTVVSKRSANTTLIRLATDDVTADIRNNIIFTQADPGHLALTNGQGILTLQNNWITESYRDTFEPTAPEITVKTGNITGTDPGFTNSALNDYRLLASSGCINQAADIALAAANYPVSHQYGDRSAVARVPHGSSMDIGAYEYEE